MKGYNYRKILQRFLKDTLVNPLDPETLPEWNDIIEDSYIVGNESVQFIIKNFCSTNKGEPDIIFIMRAIPLMDMMCDMEHIDTQNKVMPFVSLGEVAFMLYDRLLTICKYMSRDLSKIDNSRIMYFHDEEKLANAISDVMAVFMSADRVTNYRYKVYDFVEYHMRRLYADSKNSPFGIYDNIVSTTNIISKSTSGFEYFDLENSMGECDYDDDWNLDKSALEYMKKLKGIEAK